MMIKHTRLLLIVEDSDEDFEATLRALKKSSIDCEIYRCVDGEDALDFLYRRGKYFGEHNKRPSVILLDLNLPGTDGRDVLKEVKRQASLKSIPVIILSTSSNPIDIETSYQNGANSYMVKPVNYPAFTEAIKSFEDFWFRVAVLSNDIL